MILTKKQLDFLKKTLDDAALEFKLNKEKLKDEWSNTDAEEKTTLFRGIYMGKLAALDNAYNFLRKKADAAYASVKLSQETRILVAMSNLKSIQATLNKLIEEDDIDKEKIKDVLSLLEAYMSVVNDAMKQFTENK